MYIEFVIADNFLLTALAGAMAARLCHKRVNVWRLMIAATVGTTVAVFYPYFRLGWVWNTAVKVALGIVLAAIMYARTPRPIVSGMLFFGCTFALGGANYALGLLFCGESGAADFCAKYPLFPTLAIGVGVYYGVAFIVARLRVPRARAPYEYPVEVEIFGSVMRFDAFLDTGNCVFDGKSGLPVVITDSAVFSDKLGSAAMEFVKNIDKFRRITVSTAAGETEIIVLSPKRITAYSDKRGHTIYAELGICPKPSFTKGHELIIGPTVGITEGV